MKSKNKGQLTHNQKKIKSRNKKTKQTLKMITNISRKEEQTNGWGSKDICKKRIIRISN